MTERASRRAPAPIVTVVIPTHGRTAALDACLGALSAQRLGTDRFDVVVVDDGGPEALDCVIDRHRPVLHVALHRQRRSGPAVARNAGAARARGTLLAFTDDDCLPGSGWLEAMVAAVARSPDSIIGGRTINALAANPYAEASQALLAYLNSEGRRRGGQLPFVSSNNLAVARSTFEALGGFDDSFRRAGGEDRDLCERGRALGRPLVYERAAVVRHAHSMGLHGFLQQHFEYGRGARRLHEARVRRDGPPLRMQPPGFYASMLREPFRRLPARRAVPAAALIALSQGSTAAGFLTESIRERALPAGEVGLPAG